MRWYISCLPPDSIRQLPEEGVRKPEGYRRMTEPEVDEHGYRLVEEAGMGGGFITGAGSVIRPKARPENVRIMLESMV